MGYITEDYYTNTYHGEETSDDLSILIERASDVIDTITNYAIGDISLLPSVIAERVKKATAYQVEYMAANGGLSSLNGAGFSQATIGRVCFSRATEANKKGVAVAPLSIPLLESVGLL